MVPHQQVCFRDQLHVAVFDAVVHHLDEVAGPALPHPVAAGLAVHMGGDGLQNGLHMRPCRGRAARHDAGALQRPFLAAGHAGADEMEPLALQVLDPARSVREVAVAAVQDDVSLLQQGEQLLDEIIHRLARLHHQHHLARLLQRVHQLLQGIGADDVLALGAPLNKILHLAGGAVEHRHGEALALHVHDEVLPHHRQADQADVCFAHVSSFSA